VFATRTQTGLHRSGTHITALIGAQKHILELDHARVGEHQRGVITRHQGATGHNGVALGGEKIKECFANVGDGDLGSSWVHGLKNLFFDVGQSQKKTAVSREKSELGDKSA
jgi:hypothetical protein